MAARYSTLLGERVHDMSRFLDHAATRTELDRNRVMIASSSGGGTVAMLAATLDERIKGAHLPAGVHAQNAIMLVTSLVERTENVVHPRSNRVRQYYRDCEKAQRWLGLRTVQPHRTGAGTPLPRSRPLNPLRNSSMLLNEAKMGVPKIPLIRRRKVSNFGPPSVKSKIYTPDTKNDV